MRCLQVLCMCYLTLALTCPDTQGNQFPMRASEGNDNFSFQAQILVPRSPSGRDSGSGQQQDRAKERSGAQNRASGAPRNWGSSTTTSHAGMSEIQGGRAGSQGQAAPSNRIPSMNQDQQGRSPGGQGSPSPSYRGRGQDSPQASIPSERYGQDMSRNSASTVIKTFNPLIGLPRPIPYIAPDARTPNGIGYREYAGQPPAMMSPALPIDPMRRPPSSQSRQRPVARVETIAHGPSRFHADGGWERNHENLAPQWIGSKVADNPVKVLGGGEAIGYGQVITRVSGRKAFTRVDPAPGGSAKIRYEARGGVAETTIIHPASGRVKIASSDGRPVVLETETLGPASVKSEARNSPPRDHERWP